MLAVTVLLAGAAIAALLQGWDQVLSWVITPSVLLGLLVFDVVLLAFRLYAVLDAYRPTRKDSWTTVGDKEGRAGHPGLGGIPSLRPRRSRSRGRSALAWSGMAVVLFFTITPHVVAGYYTYLSRDLLTTVFVDETTSTSVSQPPSTAVEHHPIHVDDTIPDHQPHQPDNQPHHDDNDAVGDHARDRDGRRRPADDPPYRL